MVKNILQQVYSELYLTADLYDPKAMIKIDIINIIYPNEVFDIIICNHILKHVIDDIKAMLRHEARGRRI